jgi:hypothetical protein
MENSDGIHVDTTDNPSAAVLRFLNVTILHSSPMPSIFLITVSRYYPHTKPTVVCLEKGFESNYISENGEVTHRQLDEQWLAIYSLRNVIEVLEEIRSSYCFTASASGAVTRGVCNESYLVSMKNFDDV